MINSANKRAPGRLHSLSRFVDGLQSSGKYVFRRQEAFAALAISEIAFVNAARRLVRKGRIASPRRGFYVIVPLEYRTAGSPPPAWFVDDLMKSLGRAYYVGLLSAAALHGAAHQQPQEFQVVTSTPLRPAVAGRATIRFFAKRHIERTPTQAIKTETGSMRVSTPEATAFDLVRYAPAAGHLSNVATLLSDLAERLNGQRLVVVAEADHVELSHVQRLGFLLDRVGATKLADPLAAWIIKQQPRPVLLRADQQADSAPKNERWQILANEQIELDQ